MTLLRKFGSPLLAASAVAALVLGGMTLTANPTQALRPPGPQCGPTYLWVCSGPGGEVLFGGTICEKVAFEKRTGLTCVPSSY